MSFNWTPEIEQEIFDRMTGGEALSDICGTNRDEWLPSERTFYRRLSSDENFWQEYARAREAQAHREADEIRSIADAATPEDYNVARLKIDARKWRASKMAPKKYGDRLDVSSSDGTMTPKASIDVSGLSTDALREIMKAKDAAESD